LSAIFCFETIAQQDPQNMHSWHTEPELGVMPQADLHITHADTVHNAMMLLAAVPSLRISNNRFAAVPFFHSGYFAFGTTLAYHSTSRLSIYVIGYKSLSHDHLYGGFGSEGTISAHHHHKVFGELGSVTHEWNPVVCIGVSFDLYNIFRRPHKKPEYVRPITGHHRFSRKRPEYWALSCFYNFIIGSAFG
jgi:hypothetical protein